MGRRGRVGRRGRPPASWDGVGLGCGTANVARRSDETVGALQTGLPGRANDPCGECGEATARRTGCQASKGFAVIQLVEMPGTTMTDGRKTNKGPLVKQPVAMSDTRVTRLP